MPKTTLTNNFPLKTRGEFTTVDCEFSISVDGKELPSMSVLGKALEEAQEILQTAITESYKIPARI